MANDDYKADSDARTLVEAETIRADKPRLRRAMVKLKEQREAVNRAAGKDE